MKLRYLVHLNSSSESPQHQPPTSSNQYSFEGTKWAATQREKHLSRARLAEEFEPGGAENRLRETVGALFLCQLSTQDALLRTFRQKVCDVELQRGNDLLKHLELLAKAGHLEDEARRHLQQGRAQCVGQRRQHHLQEDHLPSWGSYDCHRLSHNQ